MKEYSQESVRSNFKKDGNISSFPSPTSAVSEEETRILTEYIASKNLFKVTEQDESRRKPLVLKQFFKMKRNQHVVVTSIIEEEKQISTEGKVSTIGRDFVILTNLKERKWIPYTCIESATIPFGFPTYSNTHQHFIYDNSLQQKLVQKFGETVVKKDALIRQFFEESLQTSLHFWRGTWVEVRTRRQNPNWKNCIHYKNRLTPYTPSQKRSCNSIKQNSLCINDWYLTSVETFTKKLV